MPEFVCEACDFGPCRVTWRHDTASILPCLVSGRKDTACWRKADKVFTGECKCVKICDRVLTPEEHEALYQENIEACTHRNTKILSWHQERVYDLSGKAQPYQISLMRCLDCDEEFYKIQWAQA